MKKLLSVGLALSLMFGTLGLVGCKSTPDTIAYKASRGTSITVEGAMKAWNDYVGLNKATIEQERQVKDLFNKYKAAQIALLDAAITYRSAADAPNAEAQLNAAVTAASASLADLLDLLTKFGVIKQ